jgi:prepilin-type N-terminal cleavage/methylation domain-containing protein
MHSKSSFTLIELLVVIAIVGILAGIIIVSMSGATDSATIAKGKVFSNSMRDSMSLNLTSEWLMSEGSGQTITDNWGGNTGTLGGTTSTEATDPTWVTSGCVSDNCLSFDGGDYVLTSTKFSAPDYITTSFWMKTSINTNWVWILNGGQSIPNGSYSVVIPINSRNIQYRYSDGVTGSSSLTSTTIFSDNVWVNIVIAADYVNKTVTFYKNGEKIGNSGTMTTPVKPTTTYLNFGAYNIPPSQYFYTGLLDEVRLYNSILPSSQIKQQYYAGLQKLLANKQITHDEYDQRIGFNQPKK